MSNFIIGKNLKPDILTHPNIPKPLHEVNPRNIMGKEKWDEVRQKVYASSGYVCVGCGAPKAEAKGFKWLEAHEYYHIDYENGRVEIDSLQPLCHYCHTYFPFNGGKRSSVCSDRCKVSLWRKRKRQ